MRIDWTRKRETERQFQKERNTDKEIESQYKADGEGKGERRRERQRGSDRYKQKNLERGSEVDDKYLLKEQQKMKAELTDYFQSF